MTSRLIVLALLLSTTAARAEPCNRALWNEGSDLDLTFAAYRSAFGGSARKAEFMIELIKVFDRFGEPITRRVTREQVYQALVDGGRFSKRRVDELLNLGCREGWVILSRGGFNQRWVLPEDDLVARIELMLAPTSMPE